ncbi:hypothetical protein SCA6_007816 [Theobroma cacao]
MEIQNEPLLPLDQTLLVENQRSLQINVVAKVEAEDHHTHVEQIVRRRAGDEEEADGGCELSLSLSLHHHPSSQKSNTSSTSEISSSEAFSLYSRSSYKDCSGTSSAQRSVNLDLSIALCGN